jgi:hypothetical protein
MVLDYRGGIDEKSAFAKLFAGMSYYSRFSGARWRGYFYSFFSGFLRIGLY